MQASEVKTSAEMTSAEKLENSPVLPIILGLMGAGNLVHFSSRAVLLPIYAGIMGMMVG